MKTFLINLDRSQDRLEHMRKSLAALDLPYERVLAVNGAELSPEDLARAFDARRSLAANRAQMTLGQIGCALTFLRALVVYAKRPLWHSARRTIDPGCP